MIIQFLGTACGVPTSSRYNTSIALIDDDQVYVLDCGESCARSIIRYGIDPTSVKAAFVTHPHTDHISGLPGLIAVMRPYRRTSPLSVFLPSSAIEPMTTYLELLGLTPDRHAFDLSLLPIRKGFVYEDERIKLSAYTTKHHRESYAFHIEVGQKKIVFSGDLKSPTEVAELFKHADIGIMELAHFQPEAVVSALADNKPKRLIITHLQYRRQGDGQELALVTMLRQALPDVSVRIARDGMAVEV